MKKIFILKRDIFLFIFALNFAANKYKLSTTTTTCFCTYLFVLWWISKHSNNNVIV